jgi:dUTP pyrophosphatase
MLLESYYHITNLNMTNSGAAVSLRLLYTFSVRKTMKVKRCGVHDLPVPRQQRMGDGGYDLSAAEDAVIDPGEQRLISTGFAWEIVYGFVGIIKDRSGLAVKHSVSVRAGVVDSGYRGEVKVLLYNGGDRSFSIKQGDRIAQMVVLMCAHGSVMEADTLSPSSRSTNGFGSTG